MSRYIEDKLIAGIYKITSPNNRVYIGQSWDIGERWYKYKLKADKKCRKIYASIDKYGIEKHIFEIIHELPLDCTQEIMDNYEILYWQLYKDCNIDMMNIREPGRGGRNSEETRALMKANNWNAKHKGELSSSYGKKHTPEYIAKCHSKGERSAMFGRFGEDHPRFGHPQSEEWRLARCTKIINTETLEVYESVRKAAEANKVCETTLCKILKGKYLSTAIRFPFLQYLSEYNKQKSLK